MIKAQCTSLKQFAEKVEMCVPTLCRQLKMYGIETSFREIGKNLKITREEAYNLYIFERKSLREIARMYDVSHQAVSQWLDTFGISKRNPQDPTIKKVYPKVRKPRKSKDLDVTPTPKKPRKKRVVEQDLSVEEYLTPIDMSGDDDFQD